MSSQQILGVGRHRHLADSDDSDDGTQHSVLTAALADHFRPKPYRLVARNAGFTSMADMSTFDILDYVDVTGNALQSLQGLASNFRIKTLIAKHNKLSDVTPLLRHGSLQVLDISDNSFVTTDWLARALFAPSLIALIARGNQLVMLEALSALHNIQALVLSGNQIEDISPVTQLTTLTKLSASNNCVRIIPHGIANLHQLRELRLAHNMIAALPAVEVLVKLTSLDILDLGHNRIVSLDNLASCASLTQLNVAKNPAVAQLSDIQSFIQQLCPNIQVVDGKRFAGGRRKLRVNRQRLQYGFSLEPDRKFARPPSVYYQKRTQNADEYLPSEGQNLSKREQEAERPKATNESLYGDDQSTLRKEGTKKRKHVHRQGSGQSVLKPEGLSHLVEKIDDDAIDANHFLDMARSRAGVNANATEAPATKVTVPMIKKRKRKRAQGQLDRPPVDFGAGGESQW